MSGYIVADLNRMIHLRLTSAKHLHSPDEQLYSLAGSLGYVAPEVLKNSGHGKPVDIWAIGWGISLLLVFKVNDDVP